jgi:hypothetical protein
MVTSEGPGKSTIAGKELINSTASKISDPVFFRIVSNKTRTEFAEINSTELMDLLPEI